MTSLENLAKLIIKCAREQNMSFICKFIRLIKRTNS